MHQPGSPVDVAAPPTLSRQARKAETRRALIDAAAELFAQQGMERTSLEEIAARVGLTTGAIYANFRNKEELTESVLDAYEHVTEAAPLFDATRGIAERVAALGEELVGLMDQVTPQDMMLFLEFDLYTQRHPDRAAHEREVQRTCREDEGRRLLAVAHERGEQLPFSGRDLMVLLNAIARGLAVERMRDPDLIAPAAVGRLFTLLGRALEAWSDEGQEL